MLPVVFTLAAAPPTVGPAVPGPSVGIAGGTPTTEFPGSVAVGAIAGSAGQVFCSGTVVAERFVVTAAHCLEDAATLEQMGWSIFVFEATNLLAGDITDDTTIVATHVPDSYTEGEISLENYASDIALLELAEPLGTPVPIYDQPIEVDWTGSTLTAVGYGWSSSTAQDGGVKRTLEVTIESVTKRGLVTIAADDANLCNADSGGAGYRETDDGLALAAIPVYVAPASPCAGGRTGWLRIDDWRDWILERVSPAPDDSGTPPEDTGPGVEPPVVDDDASRGCTTAPSPLWAGLLGLMALAIRGRGRDRGTSCPTAG